MFPALKIQIFMKYQISLLIAFSLLNGLFAQQVNTHAGISDQPDTSLLAQKTIAGLRNNTRAALSNRTFYVTDPGRQGLFVYDPADKNTSDDSVMTLVTAEGLRFKRITDQNNLNVRWFGATGNGLTDDWYAIQKAINYLLANTAAGRTLFFPSGVYKITKPLIIASFSGNTYRQVSINLLGPANAKDLATGMACIAPSYNNTFAIGIQSGKGVLIQNLLIRGQFTFPNKLNPIQVDTLSFNEWTDGSTRDNRLSPYSGIVIDPFSDSTAISNNSDMYPGLHGYYLAGMRRGGSTAVQIIGCSIFNFIVGVMITPSHQQNGDLIDVIDCDISSNKVAYAMGQAQSKECHVSRIKCWGATHTIFDNLSYGNWQGDGAAVPMVDGMNIAGYAKQLCRIRASAFGGVFRNIYAEGLFRLGYVGARASLSFEDCQLNFSTLGPGRPYPDFFILGSGASFYNCTLRHYMGGLGMRLILSGSNNSFEGGVMNEPPVTVCLDNRGIVPAPSFKNIGMYYSGGTLGSSNWGTSITNLPPGGWNGMGMDPVYFGNTYLYCDPLRGIDLLYKYTYNTSYERTAKLSGEPILHVNKSRWTGYFKLAKATDTSLLRTNDFILTSGLRYMDQFANESALTYPVGFIQSIQHDTVYLSNLAYGIQEGMTLNLWMDYYVTENGAFTGDMAAGSDSMMNVQGQFPAVGKRPDIPMLPPGSYVTAINAAAKTIRFSNPNNSGRSYSDYTFINGYPKVEMHSSYDLPSLQKAGKTLIGGADFYLHEMVDKNIHEPAYFLGSPSSAVYRNLNTQITGDTSLHKLRYVVRSL